MEKQVQTNEKTHKSPQKADNHAQWIRGVYMIVLFICGWIAGWLVGVIALFQFLLIVISGNNNTNLQSFGKSLSLYIKQILLYLTYNSDVKAFPFNIWPSNKEN